MSDTFTSPNPPAGGEGGPPPTPLPADSAFVATSAKETASPTPPSSPAPINPASPISRIRRILPILLLLPILAAVFILSFFFFLNQRQPKTSSFARQSLGDGGPTVQPTSSTAQSPSSSGFAGLVGKDSPSPLPNQVLSPPPSSVDSPQQAPAVSERVIFDIRAENDSFSPNQLTAHKGQVIVIYFTAVDKTYDVAFPDLYLKKIIRQGQKTPLEFQPNNFGQFIFLCQDNCPEGTTARGLLTIKP